MDTGDIKGPGLLFVQSRISRPDLLDEAAFMHWYDTDHIAEVIHTSGVNSAIRFKHHDLATVALPYLSIYPLDDIAFLTTPEFKGISVTSKLLPGTGLCYDLAEFDVGYYNIVQVHDPTGQGKGHTQTLVAEQVDTADGAGLDAWYRAEYLPALAAVPGYLRTTRYELRYARSNDQSRRFKGLASKGEAPPKRPTWLALHEFAADATVDAAALAAVQAKTQHGAAVRAAAGAWLTDVYHIAKTHGEGDLFHGRTF
ncbi:hypothetical protein SPI_06184 [Niveomyces insectorum RCEF 264]|uniref:EthD domain-containing protein n=1 Tax=Niveomyces insectorum RCEF 264 TaxID=1081102 RepID=A0A167RVL0_9HYPO|nr:hypothetical protein SPI_06184 [Niveomyces insectorum RCEF 264]